MAWVQLFWFVVTTLVSIALAPKPKAPRQAAIDDFQFPTAEEGRPIPVVFGSVMITGPNVLWYGDLSSTKIKKSSGFSSQTVGYKYYIGFHLGLCYGPVDEIGLIRWGDKDVWFGSITGNASSTINAEDAFGGKSREGGVAGDFDIYMGGNAQGANPYLVSKMDTEVPGFRGILSFIWKHGYVGTTSYIKPLSVLVKRTKAGWQGTTWYPETCELPDGTMNPIHIIYQLLTDTEWGMGMPSSFVNDAVFRDSADYYFDMGFGLSLLWSQQASIQDFLQIVIDHIGASVAFRHDTGQYIVQPVTGDYDVDDLNVYGPSEIKEIGDVQRPGWGNVVNEVTLVYTDPVTLKDTTVSAQDLGNAEAQGQRVPATVELRGIRSNEIANLVVSRELQARSTPLAQIKLTALRSFWREPSNGVFILNWPVRPKIESMVCRVLDINKGTLDDNYISVNCVQDVYAEELAIYLAQNGQDDDPDSPPTPADDPDPGIGVISTTTSAPPVVTYAGDRYFIPISPPATGAWAGHEGEFAEPDGVGGWEFTPAADGTFIYDDANGTTYQVQGGVLVVPWTPPIPSLMSYPDSVIDEADVQLVGYSIADSAFYKFPVSLLPAGGGGSSDAIDVTFDPTGTSLSATDVQAALVEVDSDVQTVAGAVTAISGSIGSAGGIASLDGAGKVPITQLPDTVVGAVDYQGTWNANTNSPNLSASSPSKGDYFVVSVAGSTSLGGITDWEVNDWAIYNGAAWQKVDNSNGTGAVTSVAGKTGVVTLVTADLTDAGAASGAAVLDAGARLPVGEQTLLVPVSEGTTARTLQAADYFTVTRFSNGSSIALTVPTNTTLAVPIGMVCGYRVAGAGMVTVAGAGGVTINIPTGKTGVSSGTGAFIALHKVGTNEWDLSGNLA